MGFVSPVSLKNLLLSGQSLRGIARQTGLDHRRLSEYSRGVKHAPTDVIKRLNANWRSTNYANLIKAGFSSKQARQARDYNFFRSQHTINEMARLTNKIVDINKKRGYKEVTREQAQEKIRKSNKDVGEIIES